jgi:hypothetical protein
MFEQINKDIAMDIDAHRSEVIPLSDAEYYADQIDNLIDGLSAQLQ